VIRNCSFGKVVPHRSRCLRVRTVTAAALLVVGLVCAPQIHAQHRPATAPSFTTLSARADAARDGGRLDEAALLYRQALALRPSWQEGWWSLGTILYDHDSYAPAARAFRRLISIDPKNGTAHLMLALCEYQLNQDDRALEHIRAAKALGFKNEAEVHHVLHYHEAMLLLRKGRYDSAIDPLRALVDEGVDSGELDTALGLAVLLIRPKAAPADGTPEHQVVLRAGRAERFNLAKRFDEARKGYSDLVQEFPTFPNLHYAYGRLLLAAEDSEAAVEQFLQEIKNNPAHVRARMQIASARYRVDSPAAIPFAQEVVKLQPTYPFGHYLLGLLYFDTHDLSRSIPELETAVRLVPREAQFHFALGNAYARAGRKEEAARERRAFVRLGGEKPSSGTTLEVEGPPDPDGDSSSADHP
jgi:tetratricopeptide (TPR) repeat protein